MVLTVAGTCLLNSSEAVESLQAVSLLQPPLFVAEL
jgi:hypothetical protein